MNIRWLITLGITFISAILIAFVPTFNWTGGRKISLFEEFAMQGQYAEFFTHLLFPVVFIFLGLLFLFIIRRPDRDRISKEETSEEDKQRKL